MPQTDDAYILSWTTTPWTLPGNVALAVGEKISYSAIRVKGEKGLYLLATDLVGKVFKDQPVEIVHDDIKGKDLVGLEYEPFFDIPSLQITAVLQDLSRRFCDDDRRHGCRAHCGDVRRG